MTRRLLATDLLGIRADTAAGPLDPLAWAERHRVFRGTPMKVPGPLREIYLSDASRLVVMKAAQMGFSEWIINLLFHTAHTGRAGRGNALYVMPTAEDAARFQQARVQPAVEASPRLYKSVGRAQSRKAADSVDLLRVADGHIYFRGANSTAGLRSMDIDTAGVDEFDEMPPDALALIEHRLDGSSAPRLRILGTPTFAGLGIEREYLAGDQRRYLITCRNCLLEQPLEWEKNVLVSGDLTTADCSAIRVCSDCHESLEAVIGEAWETSNGGRWVARAPTHYFPSYQLSQLHRPGADLVTIARKLTGSASELQQAWNQHLGLPHSAEGDQLSLSELTRLCTSPRSLAELGGRGPGHMGVDVRANRLHCWILADVDERTTLVFAGEVAGFDDASALIKRFDVKYCVVDAHPEQQAATAFRDRHRGIVYLADYVLNRWPAEWTDGVRPGGYTFGQPHLAYRVVVDRTAVMDEVVHWLREEEVVFPKDAASIPGLFAHLQAPVRSVLTSPNGRSRAVYQEGSRDDDYFHAGVYALLAWQHGANRGGGIWPEEDDAAAAEPIMKGIWTKEF